MAILHRGGTGEAGRMAVITGKVIFSGAATNVVGGTLTAASWDSGASGVLTYSPAFVGTPTIICSPAGASAVQILQTGVGVTTAGIWGIAIASAASGADFNVSIFGIASL